MGAVCYFFANNVGFGFFFKQEYKKKIVRCQEDASQTEMLNNLWGRAQISLIHVLSFGVWCSPPVLD